MYYERVNTHSASTSFAHACCGQRDASRNLVLDAKTPITKVRFSKGFAFANIEAAGGKCESKVGLESRRFIVILLGSVLLLIEFKCFGCIILRV